MTTSQDPATIAPEPPAPTVRPAPPPEGGRWRALGDHLFWGVCRTAALLIIALFILLVVVLFHRSGLAFQKLGLSVLTLAEWDPGAVAGSDPVYGSLAFVYGTVMTSLIAMLIAVPLGVGAATFLSEIAPRKVRQVASFL